ncbi:MAG: antitoxin MazE family protein [bacterium]|nr:antitoxin MazE family protein [bacterium]
MTAQEHEPTSTRRVRKYRMRLRKQGMRPIQMWVIDVRAPAFARGAHRQSAAVAVSDRAEGDQTFIGTLGLDQE